VKNSRPRIKYSQTPHSVARRIETISNKTAAALLSLINRKTIGFGQGFVDLSYSLISKELKVNPRTVSTAAKKLEHWGDILRERISYGIYRWRVVLETDEILFDPDKTYMTKPCGGLEVLIDRSGPSGSIDQDHDDRSIRTLRRECEHVNLCKMVAEDAPGEQETGALKKVFKETDLKKQHSAPISGKSGALKALPKTAVGSTDDEPLYKFCLRSLRKYGVSQRVARKLCREHEHVLIKNVLDLIPQLSGIKNVAGYLVAAIKDGGYQQTSSPQLSPARREDKKNAHQVSGGRSNYARVTDTNIKAGRHKSVMSDLDAPIVCKTAEETKTEQQWLELERLEREKSYRAEGLTLGQRFQALSDDVKAALKRLAREQLERSVPTTGRREEMLRDRTFQRIANRTVLERFFEAFERIQSCDLALKSVACCAV
jgi:hypothetical protein